MKSRLYLFLLMVFASAVTPLSAQRFTDNLDRGLVAVVPRNGSGIFLSWRIQADEYYDVAYNVYRNGTKLNAEPLTVSNYMDDSGSASNTYTVRAVVNGAEQADSPSAKVFAQSPYTAKGVAGAPAYLSIPLKDVADRNGKVIYSADGAVCEWNYTPNDACLADLDGDGEIEIILKRINQTDASLAYPNSTAKQLYEQSNLAAYTIIEAYKLNGSRLWWIDCGPNMVSLNSTELNCVAYDWDEDGKAEVIMRGADNMIIHASDGSAIYVGDMSANTRDSFRSHTDSQYAWTHTGKEYLLYLNGATAKPWSDLQGNKYSPMEFPLLRLEPGETNEKTAWGDDYGHRSSKYFFGAPFLDGRHASIFLARGIYTRTKMIAYDVDKADHTLKERWSWQNNVSGSPWYAQGNHNMSIADVDGDGCDEIIYGSMTIDNNGKGLSSSAKGHGDALHVGDLDPYRKGLEVFACNEDTKGSNYRDATTSEILYWHQHTDDDGRALMGNFTNDFPGCYGRSNSMPTNNLLSATARSINTTAGEMDNSGKGVLNGRIYWDGDLLEEYYASPGTEKEFMVMKINDSRIMQTSGVALNNDSKNNPCATGDIIGDWREEVIVRSSDNKELRIYSTDVPTTWRIPSLWYDHEYRQAMVWWVCAYNQPPHTSFFLGELEGITRAPLPLTMRNRTEIAPNSSVTSANNGQTVMLCQAGDYGVESNAAPSMIVVNASSAVSGANSGNDATTNQSPTYAYSTINLGNSASGASMNAEGMRLVKQGDGRLRLSEGTHNYTGDTEIWAGSFSFRGTLGKSNVWMNRHTEFFCGGAVSQSLTMEYGSTLYYPLNEGNNYYAANINVLNMNEGSRLVCQMNDATENDQIAIGTLNIRKQEWEYGPEYLAPVFEIQSASPLADGKYKIGTLTSVGSGDLSDIVIECNKSNSSSNVQIVKEKNDLYLVIGAYNPPGEPEVTWETTYTLDFEQTSTDNYGFTGIATFSQHEINSDSHCLHIDQGGGSGERNADKSFKNEAAFTSAKDYRFEFDWGHAVCNQDTSTTSVLTDEDAVLFYISTPKYGTSTLYTKDGAKIAEITNDGYAKAVPQKLSHFVITSNADGTYLTVTYGESTVVDNHKLSEGLQHITAINNILGRAVSHVALDNITLKEKKVSVTLSDLVLPLYEAGMFNTVKMERTLVAGYNTFCVPFNTTAEEIAGSEAKAYELYSASELDGTVSLAFKKVEAMEANKPYLLYSPKAMKVADREDIALETPTSQIVIVDGWQFVSNYTPGLNMYNKYLVSSNALRRGGSAAYLNGMRAYFVAPVTASAKVAAFSLSFDDGASTCVGSILTEAGGAETAEAIYSVGGTHRNALGKGLNIVRTADGKVKKLFVK